jgi:hypothetical protein
MYILIGMKLASKSELEEAYTLDEALKLYALWRMSQDIEAAQADDLKNKINKKGRR